MATGSRKPGTTRSLGLIVACALALVLAGVVLLVAINNRTKPKPDANELPIDVSERPPTMGGDVVDISAQATGRFQAVDKDDPTRLAWELIFSKLDPVGPGVYRLTEPRAWLYTRDGQAIFVRADTGEVKKPAQIDGQIESGTFSGHTTAMVFPSRPAVAMDPTAPDPAASLKGWDPDRDTPWLLATTDKLNFDTILLELSTQDPVTITTKDLRFDGRSLLVRGNQVKDRLEFLRVTGPGTLRYRPTQSEKDHTASGATPSASSQGEVAAAAPSATTKPSTKSATANGASAAKAGNEQVATAPEVWYRAAFTDEVVVTQQGRRLNADQLDVWARTIDNKLPDGAFGGESRVTAATALRGSLSRPSASPSIGSGLTPEIHSANRAGGVVQPVAFERYEPIDAGSPAEDDTADPGASSAPSAAASPAEARGSQPSNSHLVAPATKPDSTVVVVRPHLFKPADGDIVLTWQGTLSASPLTDSPAELADANHLFARFSAEKAGKVRFRDQATGAVGQSEIVEYAATPRVLTLRAIDPAQDRGMSDSWVHMPGGGGGLYAGRKVLAHLSTGKVEMTGPGLLASSPPSQTDPNQFGPMVVSRGVNTEDLARSRTIGWSERAEFEFATKSDLITSDLRKAFFIGGVEAKDDRSALKGEQVAADFLADDGSRRRTPSVHVFGPGEFSHHLPASAEHAAASGSNATAGAPVDPSETDTFGVTWKTSMFFDDAAKDGSENGTIECDGDAVATASGPYALDVLKSHRIHVTLGPRQDRQTRNAATGETESVIIGERQVLRAEAIGASYEREDGKNATIESRRYAPASGATASASTAHPPRELDQIVYLEGPRIIADEVAGNVQVPSAGRALFYDQRTDAEAARPSSNSAVTGQARGTTRFDWKGSMVFTRKTGVVDLLDGVEMVHKPLDNQPFARLTCTKLAAKIGTSETRTENPSVKPGRLISADAEGNVYIESGDRKKIVAENATYDALRSIIEARSTGINLVTMFDEKAAAPLVARRMRWDLGADRIEIAEPAPTTIPK